MTKSRLVPVVAVALVIATAASSAVYANPLLLLLGEGAIARALVGRAALGLGTRAAGGALASRLTFGAIPRIVGQRFLIVANNVKFRQTVTGVSASVPILFATDASAGVPPSFTNVVTSCQNGWAVVEYQGFERYEISCR